MKITDGCTVELEYSIYDSDGDLVESSADDGPVEFVQGEHEVLPGIERALDGREAGEEVEVVLDPADAYGDYDPEGIVALPRDELGDVELEPGDWIGVVVHDADDAAGPGSDEDPAEMEMRVVEVGDEEVVVDANHPLAGQRVTFRVKVLAVRPKGG